MSTISRASLPRSGNCVFFIFLILFYLLGIRNLPSWGQESILQHGPTPNSVLELNSPLDIPFLPLTPLSLGATALENSIRDHLKPQIETLPPFFRDTRLGVNLRLYYFNQDNDLTPPKSDNEAFAFGGSLAYQSGWLANFFRIGLEGFASLKLYGPESKDGALLLGPGQESYAVLGRAYGEVQYEQYTATLFRQYIDTPYVNLADNRMTPNTFEAYRMTGKYDWVQFTAGYVAQIKARNDDDFISMSEQAGAPSGRERGMIMGGVRFTPIKNLSFGAINYYVPDTVNIFYTEGNYTWPLTDQLGFKLQGQFTEQDSVGGDNLIGALHTRVGGAQASLSYHNVILRAAFSMTANTQNIISPYGDYPGYLSLIEQAFNRAGEKAWMLGLSYDFQDFVKGLSATFNFARGADAMDPAAKRGLPNQNEWDMTFDYRIPQGPLRGVWVRLRYAYVDFDSGGGHLNNVRLIINYPLSLL